MKYKCSCGGKYQILLREKILEKDIVYNIVRTMCVECSKSGEFLFDITNRETKERKLREKLSCVQTSLKDFRSSEKDFQIAEKDFQCMEKDFQGAEKDFHEAEKDFPGGEANPITTINILSDMAREIDNAFLPFGDMSDCPVNIEEFTRTVLKESHPFSPVKEKDDSKLILEEYQNLKLLYGQAVMKLQYLEEENKLLHILEETLNRKEKDIRKLQNNIAELTVELDRKETEYNELKKQLSEKDDEIEAYKKLFKENRRPAWMKLLGSK